MCFFEVLDLFIYLVEVGLRPQNAIWNFRAPRGHKHLMYFIFKHPKTNLTIVKIYHWRNSIGGISKNWNHTLHF
jgi:hypothetical protein